MEDQAWLEVESGQSEGKRWEVSRGHSLIGRAMNTDLRLRDGGVSRAHVELRRSDHRVELRDCGSKNGVFVDGVRLASGWHELAHGQRLEVGDVRLLFCSPDGLVDAALAAEGTHTRTFERARSDARPSVSLLWPLALACAFFALSLLFWR